MTRRVMIVDDDESVRSLLRLTLPAEGFEILEAPDGVAAIALLDREKPDLVLLDWHMPRASGADVLDAVKRRLPHVSVIVLTASAVHAERVRAETLGVDAFLTKPFSPLELLGEVERLLRGVDGARGHDPVP